MNLHKAAEPRRQEVIRRLNLAPHGTEALVRIREELARHMKTHPDLEALDADFAHLFSSWFNRGFLVLRRIDWTTPGQYPGKDHPLRGGPYHPGLGRPAPPAAAVRPALLRLFPSPASG